MAVSRSPSMKGISGAVVAVVLIVAVIGVVFLFPGIFRGGFGGAPVGFVGAGTNGVVIKSFTVDSPIVEKNTPTTFTLIMQNIGERQATGIKAELFGLSNEWKGINKEGKTIDVDFSKLYFGGFDGKDKEDKMEGVDTTSNTPGDTVAEDKTLKNTVSKATDTPYTASTRVSYNYDTVVEGLVRIVNRDYSKTQGATNTQSGIINLKSTGGPLTVSARTRTSIVSPDEDTPIKIILTIENKGGGRTFKLGEGPPLSDNVDYISFDTTGSSATITCGDGSEIKLINGVKTLNCDLMIGKTVDTYEDLSFKINFKYRYFVTASTSVTLLKDISGSTTSLGNNKIPSGICKGVLSRSAITGTGTCKVNLKADVNNCAGKTFVVKDSDDNQKNCGTGEIIGNVQKSDCVEFTVTPGTYRYSLFVGNTMYDSISLTCPAS